MYGAIHIYLDESGDLGFGTGGSRFFVVAALAINDPLVLNRLIKNENQRLRSNGTRSIEHKFNKSREDVRIRLLRGISGTDSIIGWRAIDKVRTKRHLRMGHDDIYQTLCADVISDVAPRNPGADVIIHLDRMASKKVIRDALTSCLLSRIDIERNGMALSNLTIEHQASYNNPGLQVQDFVVGSVFQMLERGRPHYYELIEKNVIEGIVIS